ncbi:putative ankyrin repeat protein [Fusarium oxysporum f. sp. rapae]|uniref:Putative ankyrin repeat protein n=1 Tax=Fusarium oxysporum f. sp. rapae TaxID=485398 RepID=A0A8J5TPI3_FUSOX|nr:putative ankyrin repeat protein [Fusarium oxysporum f. sp. rapae]
MAISRKLKGIPLAIEQAGAFLSMGTVEIHHYLEHFEQKYLEDTYNTLPLQYGYSYEKRRTIYAALDIVHEVLQTQNPDSVKLLNVSVFLGPGEIEFSTLANAPFPEEYCGFESNLASSSRDAERLPNTPSWLIRLRNQARDFGTAIQKLEQVSLMKINRQGSQIMSYVVHEMVRGWILGKLSDEETSECAATAFALTGMALYDESGLCSTPTMRRYTARLNAVLRVASSCIPKETVEIPEGKYASLYGSVASGFGKFCRIQGQLERAKELLTTALEYRTYSGKPVGRDHLTELEELAAVDWRLGNLVEAIDRYESLLDDCNRLLGDDDAMTFRVANALRNVRGRQDEWRRYQERACSGTSGPKRDYGIANEPPQDQDMDNEEWELVASYEEARQLLDKNDTETLQRAQELAAYYRKCARPDKEGPVREYIWQCYSTAPGRDRIESLRNLCKCYRETGKFTAIRSVLLGTEECSIFSAAIEGNIDLCEQLAKQTFNTDERDHYGCSLMHWVVEGGHLPMLQRLLGKGADVNSRDETRATVLHWAASNGDARASHLLLEGGADIEARDKGGWTALHQAAACGQKDVASILLEGGADIEAKDNNGWTALHLAVGPRGMDMISLLLEGGADAGAKDNNGRTALHIAARYSQKDVVAVLLQGGADIRAKDNNGWAALHQAAACGQKDVVSVLLGGGGGADAGAVAIDGWTALHLAAAHGQKDVVPVLLDGGADTGAKDNVGRTALHLAAGSGRKDVVLVLLEGGADTGAKDKNGWTALHVAAALGQNDVVPVLLEGGADAGAMANDGRSALHIAAASGQKNVAAVLLEKGVDAGAKDNDGLTALHLAAARGQRDVVPVLLEAGADTGAKDKDGCAALHVAAAVGEKDVVSVLLNGGADIDAKDNNGWTALHLAAALGEKDVVSVLLEKGADIGAKVNNGGTVLHVAAASGQKNVAAVLLEKGVDAEAKDNNGRTAQRWARSAGYKAVAEQLTPTKEKRFIRKRGPFPVSIQSHAYILIVRPFAASRTSLTKHQARWSLDGETVDYMGTKLHMEQVTQLVESEFRQAHSLLYDELLFGMRDVAPIEAWRLHDDLDVDDYGASWLTDERNREILAGTHDALLRQIEERADLRQVFVRLGPNGGVRLCPKAIAIYEAHVQEFLKRMLALISVPSGPPLRSPELLSITYINTGARRRSVFLWEKMVMIYVRYSKSQEQTGEEKDNIRFLPPAVGNLLLTYLAFVLPLRQAFLRQSKPGARLSPYLWSKLGGEVWRDGMVSSCLRRACMRAEVPQFQVAWWRQVAASITKEKFSAREQANFDMGEIAASEEVEDEADLAYLAGMSNHSFRTFNYSYAGSTTLTVTSSLHRAYQPFSYDFAC